MRVSENIEGGGGASLGRRHAHLQIVYSFRGVHTGLESVGGMARRNPFGREGNHSGHPP